MSYTVATVALVAIAFASSSAGTVTARDSATPADTIVFTHNNSLYTMSTTGSHVRLLAKRAEQAAVSPDGQWIAFTRFGRPSSIYVMHRDGRGTRRLTSGFGPSAWAPNGKTIYFTDQTAPGAQALFSIRPNGSQRHQLTTPTPSENTHCNTDPAPSPDGSLIAYTDSGDCDHGTSEEILAITPSGQKAQLRVQLPKPAFGPLSPNSAYHPAWSPDGKTLAYAYMDLDYAGGTTRIDKTGLYLSTATSAHRLPDSTFLDSPAWSPDGNWLLVTSAATSHQTIWLMRKDGTQRRQLSHGASDDQDPAWLTAKH